MSKRKGKESTVHSSQLTVERPSRNSRSNSSAVAEGAYVGQVGNLRRAGRVRGAPWAGPQDAILPHISTPSPPAFRGFPVLGVWNCYF